MGALIECVEQYGHILYWSEPFVYLYSVTVISKIQLQKLKKRILLTFFLHVRKNTRKHSNLKNIHVLCT